MSKAPREPENNRASAFVRRLISQWRGKGLQVLCLFLFLLFAGLFVFANCPPLWRDYDGLIQISNHPSDLTLLQYPAAYPFFSRMHVWTARIVNDWRYHTKTPINIKETVALNDTGVNALIVSQHALFALALTAFVRNCARSRLAQWAIAILLASNASLFVISNLISSEALAQILAAAFVALSFRLFLAERLTRADLATYGLCLGVSTLTRHTNSIIAMLAPTACLFRIAFIWIRERSNPTLLWKQTAIFVLAGFAGLLGANLTTRLMCRVFHVPYHSISGRTASERLGFVDRLPPEERKAFLADLQKRADDPVVKEAIPLLARSAQWDQQRDAVQKIILRDSPTLDKKILSVRSDAVLTRVVSLYFRTGNPEFVRETLDSIWRGLAMANAATVADFYLTRAEDSIDLYASKPDMSKKTRMLSSCSVEAKSRIVEFSRDPWLKLWSWAPHGAILVGSSIAALVFLLRKIGSPLGSLFALATAFTGIFATVLPLILAVYTARFTSVADLFGFLSIAIVVAHGVDSLHAGKRGPSSRETSDPRKTLTQRTSPT
jgi:hypothetical protein